MPVPMVTENHDGLKFRTTLRQPTSYLDLDWKDVGELMVVMSPAGSDTMLVLSVVSSVTAGNLELAGIVMAGLLDANRTSCWSSMVTHFLRCSTIILFDLLDGEHQLRVERFNKMYSSHLDGCVT